MSETPKAKIANIPVWCAHDALVPTVQLRPNPRNPNIHSRDQIRLLAKIISEQGFRTPIGVSKQSGYIVRGHARLAAAQHIGLDRVPVDYQDYASTDLEMADMIADNRIAELAQLDVPAVKDLLQELDTGALDMDLTGYTSVAIEQMMLQFHPPEMDYDPDESENRGMRQFSVPMTPAQYEEVTNILQRRAGGQFGDHDGNNHRQANVAYHLILRGDREI